MVEDRGIGHVPADAEDDEAEAVGFTWSALLAAHVESGRPYLEFLRRPSLSAGLYVLPAGGTDLQRPHSEDEVYIVAAGGALFSADGLTREIRAGDILFVAAGGAHRFHDISEELRLIVIFAPPEGSLAADDTADRTGGG